MTVAGHVASKARWRELEKRWPGALRREGLTAFNAEDFCAGTGEFAAGWIDDDVRRRRLVHALAQLVDQYVYRAFACSLRLDDYHVANGLYGFARHGARPYGLCAGTLVGQVRRWMAVRYPQDVTLFLFEDGDVDHQEIRRIAAAAGHGLGEPPQVWPRTWTDELGRHRFLRPIEACDLLTPEVSSLAGYFQTPSFYEHEWLTPERLSAIGAALPPGQQQETRAIPFLAR